jgi:hypothetical protein
MTHQPTLEDLAATAKLRTESTSPEIRRRSPVARWKHDVARAMKRRER